MQKTVRMVRKALLLLLIGTVILLSGCKSETAQTDVGGVTVGLWLSQINDQFGMHEYESDTPYTDVGKSDPYFADVQIAYEWDILTEEDIHIKTSDIVTEEFAAKTLIRAVGFKDVSGMSDADIYQLAQEEGYVDIENKDGSLSDDEAASCLEDAKNVWLAGKYGSDPITDYTYTEKTKDLSSLAPSDVSYNNETNTVTIPTPYAEELREDGIAILPDESGYAQPVYTEEIVDNGDGTTTIWLGEGIPELEEIFEEAVISIPKQQQNMLNSVIYDANGNMIHDGVSDEDGTVRMFQVLGIGMPARIAYKDVSSSIAFGNYTAEYKVTDSAVGITVSYKNKTTEDSIVGAFEINNITPAFECETSWGIPVYARAQLEYNIVQKLDVNMKYSQDLKLAPYNNGNGKFQTNLKKAISDGWKDKDAKGAQNVKICTIELPLVHAVSVRLDIFLSFEMDGTISVSVKQSQTAGIEYLGKGKIRSFMDHGERQTTIDAKVNADLSLYLGLSFVVLKQNVLGIGIRPGICGEASAHVYVADQLNHLLVEMENLNTDEERLEMALSGVTDVKCYICFDIEKIQIYGNIELNEGSLVTKLYKKASGGEGKWEVFRVTILENQHFEDGKQVSECTRKFTDETVAETTSFVPQATQERNDTDNNDGEVEIITGKIGIKSETVAVNAKTGKQYQIKITEVPEGYSADHLKYTSKNSEVAAVSDQGLVTPNKSGATLVYVQTPDEKYSLTIGIYISD